MKEILEKLFASDPFSSTTATVGRRLAPGRYEFVDDLGRTLQADTTMTLSPFQRVTIQAGRVVSLSGQVTTIKTYEV